MPGELTTEITSLLRAHIARVNWQDGQVAKAANIAPSTFSKLINGNAAVDIEQLDRICWAVHYPIEELIRDAEAVVGNRQTKKSWTAVRLPKSPK